MLLLIMACTIAHNNNNCTQENFGQVVYAMRTRVGDVYLRFKRNYGDMSALEVCCSYDSTAYSCSCTCVQHLHMSVRAHSHMECITDLYVIHQQQEEELTEAERAWKRERAGGNYGAGTKEVQQRNYIARKEAERKRREIFDDALAMFKQGKVEEVCWCGIALGALHTSVSYTPAVAHNSHAFPPQALIEFENVLAMEPKNYVGDNLARITDMYRVAQYNVACCYSVLGSTEAGLEALNNALKVGFEDYAKVRSDPNLANLRNNPKYKAIVDKYDEPIINEEAIKYV